MVFVTILSYKSKKSYLKSMVTEQSRSDINLIINLVSTSLNDQIYYFLIKTISKPSMTS